MRAVDIGVGHDDDALVAQIAGVAVLARAAAEREHQIGNLAVRADLGRCRAGDVQDLAADGQDRLCLAVARLLGAAAGRIALDNEQFGAFGAVGGAIGELAGQAELAARGRGLALHLALGLAAQAIVHPFEDEAQQRAAPVHVIGQEMVEMVAHRALDQRAGLGAGQPVLGLALELRLADEQAEHQLGAADDVVGGDVARALLPHQLAERADALHQCRAQARFVGAAIGRGDGVAIPAIGAVGPERPADRPFDPALAVGEILRARKEIRRRAVAPAQLLAQMIGQAAGELEHRLGRRIVGQQRRRTAPPDFDAGEQIGL